MSKLEHKSWVYDLGDGEYSVDEMNADNLHVEIYTSPTGRSLRLYVNGKPIKWKDL